MHFCTSSDSMHKPLFGFVTKLLGLPASAVLASLHILFDKSIVNTFEACDAVQGHCRLPTAPRCTKRAALCLTAGWYAGASREVTCLHGALLATGWVRTDMTRGAGAIDAKTSVGGMISVLEAHSPQDITGKWCGSISVVRITVKALQAHVVCRFTTISSNISSLLHLLC